MLMIVSLHFVQSTDIGEWIARQPTSWNKFIYQCVFMSGGWVGNFVFLRFLFGFSLRKADLQRMSEENMDYGKAIALFGVLLFV